MILRAESSAWSLWMTTGVLAIVVHLWVPAGAPNAILNEGIGAATVVAILVGVRLHRPARPRLWYLLAAAQAAVMVGDALFDYYKYVLHQDPYPSMADVSYLMLYPLTAAGLFILIKGRTSGRDRAGLLDAAIIATGLGLLSWVFLMQPLAGDLSRSLPTRLIDVAYPAGDVLLVAMLARVLTTPGARTLSYWLLAASQILTLVADVTFSVLNTMSNYEFGPVDDIFLLAYVMLGACALHPSMRSLSEVAPDRAPRISRARLAVLAGTSLLAPAILIWQGATHRHIEWLAVSAGSIALFLLVVGRISGLVAQVQDQAAQLAALAHNDGLTGVPNRRAWDLELPRELARARRARVPASVALLDVDHFKLYNDRYGHQAGDELLKEAAGAWNAQLRPGDLLARYGGEEFGVVLPGLTAEQAVEVIDRLRQVTPLDQTVSAGVACWDGVESPAQLVARADTALYEAKHAGRNRVTVSPVGSDPDLVRS
ncbi:MAG: diguanylate cyclase [Dactylosporangium sp.]|jgi:diguanylate cyclase (GGDEF)-like protein|nr:diguanylate cyclase [Dactylosporangium sp.]